MKRLDLIFVIHIDFLLDNRTLFGILISNKFTTSLAKTYPSGNKIHRIQKESNISFEFK